MEVFMLPQPCRSGDAVGGVAQFLPYNIGVVPKFLNAQTWSGWVGVWVKKRRKRPWDALP